MIQDRLFIGRGERFGHDFFYITYYSDNKSTSDGFVLQDNMMLQIEDEICQPLNFLTAAAAAKFLELVRKNKIFL